MVSLLSWHQHSIDSANLHSPISFLKPERTKQIVWALLLFEHCY